MSRSRATVSSGRCPSRECTVLGHVVVGALAVRVGQLGILLEDVFLSLPRSIVNAAITTNASLLLRSTSGGPYIAAVKVTSEVRRQELREKLWIRSLKWH